MTSENKVDFKLRGHRVPAIQRADIDYIAGRICKILKATKNSLSPSNIGFFLQRLEENGINIDVVDDDQWIDVARATVDPATGFIYMPSSLYMNLNRSAPEALRIFLHELGHIFLCHRPLLHFSDKNATEVEDSEWQADTFADCIIDLLKLPRQDRQLEFKNF
jgi:hypothetical protein